MHSLVLLTTFVALSYGAPISKLDDSKKAIDSKLLTVASLSVEKSLKPNKDGPTLMSREEIVFSSTTYPTFNAFDQNSDGVIEFEEFAASDGKDHKSNFQRADTNGDQKLTPDEFSRLPFAVYEAEQFSDSDEEPPVVFLTPPESISRYSEKDANIKPDVGFYEEMDATEFTVPKDETRVEKAEEETIRVVLPIKSNDQTSDTANKQSENHETSKSETTNSESKIMDNSKQSESSHFTADDMPVKIDDEDDEEMIEMRDEDIPAEAVDDLSEEEHYDIDEMREPQEDDRQMNDQLNRID